MCAEEQTAGCQLFKWEVVSFDLGRLLWPWFLINSQGKVVLWLCIGSKGSKSSCNGENRRTEKLPRFIYCMFIHDNVDCYHLEYILYYFLLFFKCLKNVLWFNNFKSSIWNNLASMLFHHSSSFWNPQSVLWILRVPLCF